MKTRNSVFIATSLDGYIADKNREIDWLHSIPNPENNDMGYEKFISQIDALVMGRITFETVRAFDMDWPYEKPVFVLSNTLTEVPSELKNKVHIVNGLLTDILDSIHKRGLLRLYIDGGKTIQSFLNEDLIDEMVLTTIPILLGGGFPLFSDMSNRLNFECVDSRIYLNKIVQSHFKRMR